MKERKTIRSGMNSFVLLERNLGFPPLMVGCLFICLFVVLVAGATPDHPTPPTMEPPQILVLALLLLVVVVLLSSSSTVSCIYRSTENCSGIRKYIYISLELFFSQRRL
jgi:heme/copper-type cytochrome/quinol oxidase subunit 3